MSRLWYTYDGPTYKVLRINSVQYPSVGTIKGTFNTDIDPTMDPTWKGPFYTLGHAKIEKIIIENQLDITYGTALFYGLEKVTTIEGFKYIGGGLKNCRKMFAGMKSLNQDIKLVNFRTSTCTDFSYMFSECGAAGISIDLNGMNTTIATTMSHMFDGCGASAINFIGSSSKSVVDSSYMFANCANLTEIKGDESLLRFEGVTLDTNMFADSPNLPNFDAGSIGKEKAIKKEDGGYFTLIPRPEVAVRTRIQLKHDIKENWLTYDPLPLEGETCYEMDTNLFKVGDGIHKYSELPYWNEIPEINVDSETLIVNSEGLVEAVVFKGAHIDFPPVNKPTTLDTVDANGIYLFTKPDEAIFQVGDVFEIESVTIPATINAGFRIIINTYMYPRWFKTFLSLDDDFTAYKGQTLNNLLMTITSKTDDQNGSCAIVKEKYHYDGARGIVPAPTSSEVGYFLNASGKWEPIPEIDVFKGATKTEKGEKGLVPQPWPGQRFRYLRGNGTWDFPHNIYNGEIYNDPADDVKVVDLYGVSELPADEYGIVYPGVTLHVRCYQEDKVHTAPLEIKINGQDKSIYWLNGAPVFRMPTEFTMTNIWGSWKIIDVTSSFKADETEDGWDGYDGLVPHPDSESRENFLRGDGTWAEIKVFEGVTTLEHDYDYSASVISVAADRIVLKNTEITSFKELPFAVKVENITFPDMLGGDGIIEILYDRDKIQNGDLYNKEYVSGKHFDAALFTFRKVTVGDPNVTVTDISYKVDGKKGLVPAPTTSEDGYFLNANGNWEEVPIYTGIEPVHVNDDHEISVDVYQGYEQNKVEYYDYLAADNSTFGSGTWNIYVDDNHITRSSDFHNKIIRIKNFPAISVADYCDVRISKPDGSAALAIGFENPAADAAKVSGKAFNNLLIKVIRQAGAEGGAVASVIGEAEVTPFVDGKRGLVPDSSEGDVDKFLHADGTWRQVSSNVFCGTSASDASSAVKVITLSTSLPKTSDGKILEGTELNVVLTNEDDNHDNGVKLEVADVVSSIVWNNSGEIVKQLPTSFTAVYINGWRLTDVTSPFKSEKAETLEPTITVTSIGVDNRQLTINIAEGMENVKVGSILAVGNIVFPVLLADDFRFQLRHGNRELNCYIDEEVVISRLSDKYYTNLMIEVTELIDTPATDFRCNFYEGPSKVIDTGYDGLVPKPAASEREYFLKGTGEWEEITTFKGLNVGWPNPDCTAEISTWTDTLLVLKTNLTTIDESAPISVEVDNFVPQSKWSADNFNVLVCQKNNQFKKKFKFTAEQLDFIKSKTFEKIIFNVGAGETLLTICDVEVIAEPILLEGKEGLVPAPTTSEDGYFLNADGKWEPVSSNVFCGTSTSDASSAVKTITLTNSTSLPKTSDGKIVEGTELNVVLGNEDNTHDEAVKLEVANDTSTIVWNNSGESVKQLPRAFTAVYINGWRLVDVNTSFKSEKTETLVPTIPTSYVEVTNMQLTVKIDRDMDDVKVGSILTAGDVTFPELVANDFRFQLRHSNRELNCYIDEDVVTARLTNRRYTNLMIEVTELIMDTDFRCNFYEGTSKVINVGYDGLVPKASNAEREYFLKGTGEWAEVDLSVFEGTDGAADGKKGLVPAPTTSKAGYFLNASGNWKEVPVYTGVDPVHVDSDYKISVDTFTGYHTAEKASDYEGTVTYFAADKLNIDISGAEKAKTPCSIKLRNVSVPSDITSGAKAFKITWLGIASISGTISNADDIAGKYFRTALFSVSSSSTVGTLTDAEIPVESKKGLVPVSTSSEEGYFLNADGTWKEIETPVFEGIQETWPETTNELMSSTVLSNKIILQVTNDIDKDIPTVVKVNNITFPDNFTGYGEFASSLRNYYGAPRKEFRFTEAQSALVSGKTFETLIFKVGAGQYDCTLELIDSADLADGKKGLVPAPTTSEVGYFLNADGTWKEVDLSVFEGTDGISDGDNGLVPAPTTSETGYFLNADGTWKEVDLSVFEGVVTDYIDYDYLATASGISSTGMTVKLLADTTPTINELIDKKIRIKDITFNTGLSVTPFKVTIDGVATLELTDPNDYQTKLRRKSFNNLIFAVVQVSEAAGTVEKVQIIGEAPIESLDGKKGLVPAPTTSEVDYFLNANGNWEPIPEIDVFQGATKTEKGEKGLVPQPENDDQDKYLKGDGTWSNIPIWSGTQAQYDALGTYDDGRVYIIVG